MRLSEAGCGLEARKAKYASSVAEALQRVPGVVSVTFTGSFVETAGLEGISDIDVVVVVKELTGPVFEACRSAVAGVPLGELGLPNHRLIINDTFGPLKFDEADTVVVHLMVYDIAGHREHVLKSPFTCLDWERSPHHFGPSLRTLYPVLRLQPRQIVEARRSLGDYLNDIASATISFRRLAFSEGGRTEITERLPLDRRHQGEYAFHIVRNLVGNYAKLVLKENTRMTDDRMSGFLREHLPACSCFADWFADLRRIKHSRGDEFPGDTLPRTREFLDAFSSEIQNTWSTRAVRHVFVRHARTGLNDGSFLGQRRDPPISAAPEAADVSFDCVYSSPAARCVQTAAALAPDASPRIDRRLHEIDYGSAEGLAFAGLAARHPEIVEAWARGEDSPFPGGENTADVAARLDSFVRELPQEPALVVTHNVVLRCLLGKELGLPVRCWHRITVPHLERFEVLRLDGSTFLNLAPPQIAAISDSIAGHLE